MEVSVENDAINPNHYKSQCSIECIESMMVAFGVEAVYDFCICNAYKYLWRFENKNGSEDLNKANWYINKAEELFDKYSNCSDVNFQYLMKEDVVLLRDLLLKKMV